MKVITILTLFFFFFQTNLNALNKENITKKLNQTDNFSFNFIQTIGGKDEKGECVIQYPKKMFCKYDSRKNKIIVSNGSSIVIKTDRQYYRYPIKSTPFDFILDKNFLINQIQKLEGRMINDRYYNFSMKKNNNNINIFFDKKDSNLIGWQTEDIYQNLTITFISNIKINQKIDKKIFKLPQMN